MAEKEPGMFENFLADPAAAAKIGFPLFLFAHKEVGNRARAKQQMAAINQEVDKAKAITTIADELLGSGQGFGGQTVQTGLASALESRLGISPERALTGAIGAQTRAQEVGTARLATADALEAAGSGTRSSNLDQLNIQGAAGIAGLAKDAAGAQLQRRTQALQQQDVRRTNLTKLQQAEDFRVKVAAGQNADALAAFESVVKPEPGSVTEQQLQLAGALDDASPLKGKILANMAAQLDVAAKAETKTASDRFAERRLFKQNAKQLRSVMSALPEELRPHARGLLAAGEDPEGLIPELIKDAQDAMKSKIAGPSTVINVGGKEATTAVKTDMQTALVQANEISLSLAAVKDTFNPDFLTLQGTAKIGFDRALDLVGAGKPDKNRLVGKAAAFKAIALNRFLRFRKFITGVAGGKEEMEAIAEAFPNPKTDTASEFLAKLDIVTRLQLGHKANLESMLENGQPITEAVFLEAFRNAKVEVFQQSDQALRPDAIPEPLTEQQQAQLDAASQDDIMAELKRRGVGDGGTGQ